MNTYRDPAEMTPDERLNEVAAILAAGLLRMRKGPVNKGVGACAKAEETTGFPEGKEAFMVTPAQGNRE